MRNSLMSWALAVSLVLATMAITAGQAHGQQEGFGLNPETFIAKTHPHVPLAERDSTDKRRNKHREVAIETIRDAEPVTEAGAHPDATTHFTFRTEESEPGELRPEGSPIGSVRDVIIDLPPGFLGNPEAVPPCSFEDLQDFAAAPGHSRSTCPPASQVGVVSLDLVGLSGWETNPVFRVNRPARAPAAFAFTAAGQSIMLTPRLRSEGDYGLAIESRKVAAFPIAIRSLSMTLWGVPADPKHDPDRWRQSLDDPGWGEIAGIEPRPFIINPPRCNTGELAAEISMRSWQEPDRLLPRDLADPAEAAEYTATSPEPTGCAFLPTFEPEMDMRPAENEAGSPSAYDVELTMPYNDDPEGRAGAHVKRVEVELPEGVTVSPSAAHGLEACSDAEAGFGTQSVANCPVASKIGRVSVETPLLPDPIQGAAYIGEPTADQLLRLFIILEGFGVVVRVEGDVETDPETGQITAVFDDNPQVPFTDFKVRFDPGARASLVNPSDCGAHEVRTEITSWNDDVHVSTSEFSVDGTARECASEPPFEPWLSAGSVNPTATASSPFLVKFGRTDADEYVSSIDVDMPEGLVAKVAGVPLCPSASADMGACSEHSRIGHLQIASGAGSEPYWVPAPGKEPTAVYLSGAYRGAPYSLSIVAHAQAGPFDLGRVVVRAPIEVDERTTELSIDVAESRIFDRFGDLAKVIPDEMPTILEGIPLRLKEARIVIDREGFMVNPTDCRTQAISAEIGAADGRTSEVTSPFRATDCAALDFAPRFGMRILNPGRRSTLRSFNPAIRFGVAPREGHANIAAAAVTLPSSIILDQSNIRTICTRDQLADRECPRASVYGFARAWSPLLDEPLVGPVFLGSSDNQLPDLIADMRGEVRVVLQGEILGTGDGRIRNVFRFVPDVQVSRFQLTMFGGQNRGVLVNSRDLCRSPERGVTHFFGQNGKRQVTRPRVGLSFRGCRQVLRREAIRQAKRRRALRKAVRTGNMTPAQARRQIRT